MCWVLVLLLFWFMMIVCTYMIFYYESANGPHLELMRSKGSVPFLLLRGFFWNLYSHVALAALAITGLHRKFWQLPSEPGSRTPIIFVHGLFHNRTAWFLYMRWFRKWGWRHVKAVNLTGKFGSIKDFAQILAREIDEVLAETGSDKIDLVGHSMGGLVIRSYLTENSVRPKVRRIVTLASPHAGSRMAVFTIGAAGKEMLPGSSFLQSLNHGGNQVHEKSTLYALYTIVDNIVLPNESARLSGAGAKNIEAPVVNHIGLVVSKQTARLVRQCLDEP